MSFYESSYYRDLLEEIAEIVISKVNNPLAIPSDYLRKFLRHSIHVDQHKVTIFIPVYWAKAYHDGRKALTKSGNGKKLLWFVDQHEDPRHKGFYPKSKGARRRATADMLKSFIEHDREVVRKYKLRNGITRMTSADYSSLYLSKQLKLVWSDHSKATEKPLNPFFSFKSGSPLSNVKDDIKKALVIATKAYAKDELKKKFKKKFK